MPVSPRWPCVIHQTGYAISVPSPIATQPDFGGARATESYELSIEGGSGTLITLKGRYVTAQTIGTRR